MKIKASTFLAALALIMASCTNKNEPAVVETASTPSPTQQLTLTASMPDDGSQTRLALAETTESNISVKWKDGDKLNLCFVSNSGTVVKTVSDVPVTNIREDGKKADFAIDIPTGITEPFNLYGVYGAAFNGADTKEILFPATPIRAALTDSEPLCVMRFAAEGLTAASSVSVTFSHLGAILGVWLTNSTATNYTLTSLAITGNDSYNWLYNASGQALYHIAAGTFTDNKEGNVLTFPAISTTITAGATEKVYYWFAPTATPDNTKTITATLNRTAMSQTLPAKAFEKGTYYRLKLVWDGTVWKRPWNPLSFFATHNLDVLNTLATGDEQTAKGKMYQWGRNVPFAAEGSVTTVAGPASSWSDAKIWSADFISGSRVWYPSPQATDTWTFITGQASSAPASYKGTNISRPGDPCPEGYHVPSILDWTTILPFSSTGYGIRFNSNYLNRSEQADLDRDGTAENYTADYQSISSSSMVALKFKATPYTTAFKYEWQPATNAMKISAVQVSQSATITQIADAAFDWSEAVIRYFPTAGNRFHNGGTIDPTYVNVGFYWTSQARTTENIWVVYMNSATAYSTPDDAGCYWARSGNAYLVRCVRN